MICGQCSDDQPEGRKFCGSCGVQVSYHCRYCGALNHTRFRFCADCGSGLVAGAVALAAVSVGGSAAASGVIASSGAAPDGAGDSRAATPTAESTVNDDTWQRLGLAEGERRKVTVLFADVSGFTAMSEKLDPEEANIIVKDVMSELAAIVRGYDGYIEKFIGDAICAIYGAPIAHEDEPERAVRAAIDMHAALLKRAARFPDLPELSMHIGVNTGLVVAGTVGDGTQFGVTGDTINTAARLMDKAVRYQTFVSAETARRIRQGFLLEDMGTYQMKGKEIPVQAYQVLRELTDDEAAEAKVLRAPLTGRAQELNVLLAAVERTSREPGGATVVVVGDAGLGKSRLLDEVALSVAGEMQVFRAAARVHGAKNFGLLSDAVRPVVDAMPEGADKQATALLHGEGGASLTELQNAVARALVTQSKSKPICILLDNMEFVDQSSADLLRALIRLTAEANVLWVVATRAGKLAIDLAAISDVPVTRLLLRPLSDEATASLFTSLLTGAVDAALSHRLADRAEGNPAFAEAIALQLVDEGVVVEGATGGWQLVGDPESVEIPGTLQELIEARIDALSSGAHKALQEAAVIGLAFHRSLLAAVSSVSVNLDGALAELVDADLLREPSIVDPDGDHQFKSPLVREVAYSGILLRSRAALHRRVGDAILAEHTADDDAVAEILAHHFEEASEFERAVHYLEIASMRAENAYAFRRSAVLCSKVLSLRTKHPGVVDDVTAAHMFERRGVAAMIDNDHDEMRSDLTAAADLWLACGSNYEAARVQDHLAWYLALAYQPDAAEAMAILALASSTTAAANGGKTAIGKADAVNTGVALTRAFLQAVRGQPTAALAALPELAMAASSTGDPVVDLRGQIIWGAVEHWEGDSASARERLHRARLTALEARYPVLYSQAAWWLMLAEMELGRYARAVALGEELQAFAQETGDKLAEIRVCSAIGSMLRDLGDLRGARDQSARSLALAAETQAPGEERVPAILTLAECSLDAGDTADAKVRLEAADALMVQESWMAWRFGARQAFVKARAALAGGDAQGALEAAGHLRQHLSGTRSRKDYLRADLVEGEARLLLGDPVGEQLLDRSAQFATEIGSLYYQVVANEALARLVPSRAEAATAIAARARESLVAAASQVSMLAATDPSAERSTRATQRLKAIQLPGPPPSAPPVPPVSPAAIPTTPTTNT